VGETVASAGLDAWLAVDLKGPNVAAACAIPGDDGTARVWLAGWFRL
jgi:hypothetical protein